MRRFLDVGFEAIVRRGNDAVDLASDFRIGVDAIAELGQHLRFFRHVQFFRNARAFSSRFSHRRSP